MIHIDLSFSQFVARETKRFVINSTAHLYCYKSEHRCYFYFRYSGFDGRRREMPLLRSFLLNVSRTDWNRMKKEAVRQSLLHWAERYDKVNPVDPIEKRRSRHPRWQSHGKRNIPTFGQLMEAWLQTLKDANTWSNWKKRATHYQGLLRHYAVSIANQTVNQIKPADIWLVLKPIWQSRPCTADLLLGLFNKVFIWAMHQLDGKTGQKKWEIHENPADRRGVLSQEIQLFSKHRAKQENFSALDYHQIPAFMKVLYEENSSLALGLMFQILTATRTQAVRLMKWDEVHWHETGATWEIPESHDKMKDRGRHQKSSRERTIYLSKQALQVMETARMLSSASASDYVFPGRFKDRPMGITSFNTLISRLDRQKEKEDSQIGCVPSETCGWKDLQKYAAWKKIQQIPGQKPPKFVMTAHGTSRAGFKSWAMNQKDEQGRPKYREVVIEFSLLHQDRNDHFNGAYSRNGYVEERIALMEDWGQFCFSLIDAEQSVKQQEKRKKP